MTDDAFLLFLIITTCVCLYITIVIDFDREKYKQLCVKHNLEFADWNNNVITCFDPKTNEMKAFKNEL